MELSIAAFDVGTTAVKGTLVDSSGKVHAADTRGIPTIRDTFGATQNPLDWYDAFCGVSRTLLGAGGRADAIVMSGQMQDLIPVGSDGLPAAPTILYSDARAGQEAQEMLAKIGADVLPAATGNVFDGSMPFAKLLWLKRHLPGAYANTQKILISAKDYVDFRLTGAYATDVTSASTAGLMHIREFRWMKEWCAPLGLDAALLPDIRRAYDKIGVVSAAAAKETGYEAGTPVFCGAGDAGAATLASGVSREGEYNINLGTSGWIACVSAQPSDTQGVFNLAAIYEGAYVHASPFFNGGLVHKWAASLLAPEERGDRYGYIAALLRESAPFAHGLIALPYLAGERFPVSDSHVRGCLFGLTPETTKADVARACLEGVAYSLREGMERMGVEPVDISLVGGGAKESAWCQIIADVFQRELDVYENAEHLPCVAMASVALKGLGRESTDIRGFLNAATKRYAPDCALAEGYETQFKRYRRLYPSVRGLF